MEHRVRVSYDRAVIAEAARHFAMRSIRKDGFAAFLALLVGLGLLIASGDRSWVVGVFGAGVVVAVAFGVLDRGPVTSTTGLVPLAHRVPRPSPRSRMARESHLEEHPMANRVRAAFVGAGNRAFSAHYPAVKRLADEVELAAVCEVDPARLARGADYFDLPPERRYDDLNRMLAEVKPELVYTIMGPTFVRPVAERCLAAGAHVVVEKPPGASIAEVEALVRAARTANRQGMVCFQRRHAAVVQETRRRILARGPVTMCVLQFHKDLIPSGPSKDGMTTLWDDVVHVVDLARFLCGGRVEEVHAYRDNPFTDWPSLYNALVRFDSGATALISGNRTSGGRFLRAEAHGREIGAYMDDLPRAVRFLQDNAREPEEILGSQLSGSDEERTYDGVVEMHRHFLECARKNQPATSSFDDALETMRLCARIEQGARQPAAASR